MFKKIVISLLIVATILVVFRVIIGDSYFTKDSDYKKIQSNSANFVGD